VETLTAQQQHHSSAVINTVPAHDANVAAATQQSTCEPDNAQVGCDGKNDIT